MPIVPRDALPDDGDARAALLARTFQRQVVSCTDVDAGWSVQVGWTSNEEVYIDPHLRHGLRWWDDGLSVDRIHLGVRLHDDFQLSLDDSWTLFAWSSWLAGEAAEGRRPDAVTILHLDSHTDLMSPLLTRGGDAVITDVISGRPFDLIDPASVAAAICSGAVGIGSFIAPIIHHVPNVTVCHLSPASRFRFRPGAYALNPALRHDALFPPSPRLAVDIAEIDSDAGRYVVTDDLHALLDRIPAGPVLLHVDMDYFNNCFDGTPAWREDGTRHDPDENSVLEEIDRVFSVIAAHPAGSSIADIAVALSPGFFPATLWPAAMDRMSAAICKLQPSFAGAAAHE